MSILTKALENNIKMAITEVVMQLAAVIILLATVAFVMRTQDQNSDDFTFRGIIRNDFTMLHNSNVPSDGDEKSSKESLSYSSLTNNKKEYLKESQINEEREKLQPLALRKEVPEQESRQRKEISGAPSSNTPTRLTVNDNLINLPSAAPSASSPKNITVIYEMTRVSCRGRCAKERDLGETNVFHFLCFCDDYCETLTDCCYDYHKHCKNDFGYSDPNPPGLVVRYSQRKVKASKTSIFASLFAFKKKFIVKRNRTIAGFERVLSLVLRKVNHKHKFRRKRNISPPGPEGDPSTTNSISIPGFINKSQNSSPTATTTTQEFFHPTEDINITCDVDHLSCKNRCAKERDLGQTNESYLFCYCDEYCEIFADCCFDYRHHCKNESGHFYLNTSQLICNKTSNISNDESISENYFKCISSPNENGPSGTNGIWMIADCPKNFPKTPEQAKCVAESSLSYQKHKDNIPVIARDGKTYKNRFCSRCHGVSDGELSYYALSYSCRILPPRNYNHDNTLDFLFSYCSISWKPNSGDQRRYCYSNIMKRCSRAAPKSLWEGCHDGPAGIVTSREPKGQGYKNVYCALCQSVTSLVCGPGPRTESNCTITNACGSPAPFSVIMNLGFSGQSNQLNIPHQTQVSCTNGKVYDPHLELCRPGIAGAPRQTGSDSYSVSIWIRKKTNPFENVIDTSQEQLLFLQGFNKALIDLSVSNINIRTEQNTYRIMFDFVKKVNKTRNQQRLPTSLFADDLLKFSRPIEFQINSKNFIIIKVTSRRLTCVVVERFLPHEYTIAAHPELAAYIHRTKEVIIHHHYYVSDSRNSSNGTITVCRKRLRLPCMNGTYIKLLAHEVTKFPNKSVLWNNGGKVYNEGTYEKQNDTFWICTNFTVNGTKEIWLEEVVEHSLKIITIVGLSLSVGSLCTLLITYSIFSELRTLPGISLMNLSFSVLTSHLLWLVGSGLTSETKLCTAISVGLHFVFLTSFIWMSIIAKDTWCAFTKNRCSTNGMTQREKRKRYLRSMAIGWVSPLMFCLFTFTLDKTNTVDIGYGGTEGCWIQSTSSNLYFFAAPMGVLLLLNAVFFILTVKSIRESVKKLQMATGKKRSKRELGIFVRISALMGFTWVFGFMSSLHLYLSYAFVISCTLQGVYIAVAFLFTKRIMKLYLVMLSTGRSSTSTKMSSSSHQKSKTEQPLHICSSLNCTNRKKNSFEIRTEFHSVEVVKNQGTESTDTADTRL